MSITAFNFGGAGGLPFTIFTPVEWAPQNTQGAGNPAPTGNTGADYGGSGITPDLLASAQANLAGIAYTGLNTITYGGYNSLGLTGALFSNWGNTLAQIAQQNANTFQQAVNNSASACSGFLQCLF